MKKILLTLLLLNSISYGAFFGLFGDDDNASKEQVETVIDEATVENNATFIEQEIITDDNTTQTEVVEENTKVITEDQNQTVQDEVETVATVQQPAQTQKEISKFEKTFIKHVAYNHYKNAVKMMFDKEHKQAYSEAMKAKAIFDNEATGKEIVLPYIPGFIRENAQTPVRIYYKIFETQSYELHRLIRKIKLLNPPIPMVIFNQTSTYVDITIQNYGDLPLDKFGIEVNFEQVKVFDKINPGDTKVYRYNKAVQLEDIRFSEEFGFAPKDITLSMQ